MNPIVPTQFRVCWRREETSAAQIGNFKIKALCDSNLIDRTLFPSTHIRVSIICVFLPRTSDLGNWKCTDFLFRLKTADTQIYEIPWAFPCQHSYSLVPFKIFWDMFMCQESVTALKQTPTLSFNPCALHVVHPTWLPCVKWFNGIFTFLYQPYSRQFPNQQRPFWPS